MSNVAGKESALLVIDVQSGVVAQAFNRTSVISNIKLAIDKARSANVPVIWVQHSDDGLVLQSAEWQLAPEMNPKLNEPLVHKTFRSAFVETDLQSILQNLEIGHLYVCGAETNNCVRHTSHNALELGYDVTLLEDAHTTTSFEWKTYKVEAAVVIDEQNTNFMGYKLPGRNAAVVSVSKLVF